MLHLFFLFFSFFVFSHAADPYVCDGINSFNAPVDLSSIYFPSTWNQSTSVPQFALNQECRWNIEVPQGYWAFVTLDAVIPEQSSLNVVYVNGKEEYLRGTVSNNPFGFLFPSFSIVLRAAGNTVGALAFRVDYFKMPTFNPDTFLLSATDPEVIPHLNLSACVITAPTTQISLIASNSSDISFYYFTRLFAVFDGPDTSSSYLGNLFDVMMSGTQLVSTGKQLTIVNLYPALDTIGNYIMVQDYSNVKQFSNYRFATNHVTSDSNFVLDATNGTSAIVTLSANNLYLKSVQIAESSSLSIYYGAIKSSNIVHVYKSNGDSFPQKLNNYMTTFVLDSNTGNIEITSDELLSSWGNAFDGKNGYITSPKYGILNVYQAIIETFIGDDYYNYTTRIIDHGLVGDATLQITTYDKSNEIVDDHTYTKDNLPPTTQDVHPGKSMSVTYQTNGSNSTGVLLDFSVSTRSSSFVPVCNVTYTVAANVKGTIYYPNTWNVSLPDPYYTASKTNYLDCRWNIEVPQGYYANFEVRASTSAPSTLTVTYSNGDVEVVPHSSSLEPYFMLAPSFSIHLNAITNGTLGFSVSYVKLPDFNPSSYALAPNNDPVILDYFNSTVLTSTSQVSLITSDTYYPDVNSFLRAFLIFDGQNMNAQFVGTLYKALNENNQTVSSGKFLTIVNLLNGDSLGNIIMVQDYSNVKQFNQYKYASCIASPCSVGMNAVQGTAAVVSVTKMSRYLTDISISSTSNLKVYYGTINDQNLVYNYNSTARRSSFPQKFNNYITTFVLDTQTGLLILDFSANFVGGWTSSYDGRQGFISSPSLNEISSNQSVIETFIGNDNYNYTTRVINHGLTGNATLQITTYDASNNAVDDHIYTKDNLPPTISDVHPGKSLSVIYQASGQNTTGVLIDFSIAKLDSSATNCILWLTFVVSLLFL